jgi:hypothetical protein
MTVHPAGHFFAVGYEDGTIAFWAVEDETQPLVVKRLEETGPQEVEPIFKLSWCGFSNSADPRGGDTVLIILGGLTLGSSPGLTVQLLSAFNPPDPPAVVPSEAQASVHPFIKSHMRQSLVPVQSYFYFTSGPIHDYMVIPHSSPHFAGTIDASEILLLYEPPTGARILEGYQFPPPIFFDTVLSPTSPLARGSHDDDPLDNLASTLKELEITIDPQPIDLPMTLSPPVLSGRLVAFDREAYQSFEPVIDSHSSFLRGGVAWADESQASEMKLAKVWRL